MKELAELKNSIKKKKSGRKKSTITEIDKFYQDNKSDTW